jgi:digeranylgeranylglycerophospholipid reductase
VFLRRRSIFVFITADSQKQNQPYDVIIVGGGPAGLAAAKSSAEGGAKTLVLEEHREIGLPHHCSGWLWSCPYSETLFRLPDFKKVILQKLDSQSIYGPSGKLIINFPMKGWVVNRVEFDKVLAKRAIRAGADIALNSRVVSLLTDNERVRGVSAESSGQTIDIESKVVIGADGIRSLISGVAKQANLAEPRNIYSDVQVEFTRVAGLNPKATEIYLGSFCGTEFGFLAPTGKDSMMLSLGNLDKYEIARKEYPPLMSKLKDAVPLAIFGGLGYVGGNRPFKKLVKDGLLIAGDAAGYDLIIRVLILGSYAGQVAAKAVKEGNISAARLSEYDKKRAKGYLDAPEPLSLRELLRARGFNIRYEPHALNKIPDTEIEKVLSMLGENMKMSKETPGLAKMELVE